MNKKQEVLLSLQCAALSNEALMNNIYKKCLGNSDKVGAEISKLSLSILNSSDSIYNTNYPTSYTKNKLEG